jgi:hypothetical protein
MTRGYAGAALGALTAGAGLAGLLTLQLAGRSVGHTSTLAAMTVLLGFWVAVTDAVPSIGVALWVLAFTNTLPFVNLDVLSVHGNVQPSDALIAALLLGTVLPAVRLGPGLRDLKWQRRAMILAMCFIIWWAFTLLRTYWFGAAPLSFAALYGRDLLYMPIALICATCLLRRVADVLNVLVVLAAAASIYAAAYLAGVLTGASVSWILHPYLVINSAGLVQPFQYSSWLVVCLLPVAFWRGMPGRGWRLWAWRTCALLLGTQVLVTLTRGNYIGVGLGLAVSIAAVFIAPQYSELRRGLAARWFFIASVVSAGALSLTVALPSLLSTRGATNIVLSRLSSVFAIVGGGHGPQDANWVYRVALLRAMSRVLGGDWLWGLGFLHPSVHYVAQLPMGSIRNTDVGVSNTLMTLGLIGTVLAFAPTLLGLLRGFTSDGGRPLRLEAAASLAGLTGFFACVFGSALTLAYGIWPITGVLIVAAFVLAERPPEPS